MGLLSYFSKAKAQRLHESGQQLSDEGKEDEAIKKYKEAIALDPQKSASYYNIGLIYKYRGDWPNSFEFNKKAYELVPDNEAARWNLAIAATALRDWLTARSAWRDNGFELDEGDGPINANFGRTPVRLNPDDNGEVVWTRRIDPVRAKIESVPLPSSGFAFNDVVLHDGAPVGYRMLGERECPVFNVLELFEASGFSTFKIMAEVSDSSELELLDTIFENCEISLEDWTASIRTLCKACSEGRPHEQHDHGSGEDEWSTTRELGVAATSLEELEAALGDWMKASESRILSVECMLDRR